MECYWFSKKGVRPTLGQVCICVHRLEPRLHVGGPAGQVKSHGNTGPWEEGRAAPREAPRRGPDARARAPRGPLSQPGAPRGRARLGESAGGCRGRGPQDCRLPGSQGETRVSRPRASKIAAPGPLDFGPPAADPERTGGRGLKPPAGGALLWRPQGVPSLPGCPPAGPRFAATAMSKPLRRLGH